MSRVDPVLTGASVRRVREALALDRTRFAALLGCDPRTLYRWENVGEATLRIDPFQRRLLVLLDQVIARRGDDASLILGRRIFKALEQGDTLRGLYVLLIAAFD